MGPQEEENLANMMSLGKKKRRRKKKGRRNRAARQAPKTNNIVNMTDKEIDALVDESNEF